MYLVGIDERRFALQVRLHFLQHFGGAFADRRARKPAGLLGMLQPRDPYAALVRDPSLAAAAAEECLRWGSVVTLSIEQAQAHVDLSGASLSPGDDVWIVLPAANQ